MHPCPERARRGRSEHAPHAATAPVAFRAQRRGRVRAGGADRPVLRAAVAARPRRLGLAGRRRDAVRHCHRVAAGADADHCRARDHRGGHRGGGGAPGGLARAARAQARARRRAAARQRGGAHRRHGGRRARRDQQPVRRDPGDPHDGQGQRRGLAERSRRLARRGGERHEGRLVRAELRPPRAARGRGRRAEAAVVAGVLPVADRAEPLLPAQGRPADPHLGGAEHARPGPDDAPDERPDARVAARLLPRRHDRGGVQRRGRRARGAAARRPARRNHRGRHVPRRVRALPRRVERRGVQRSHGPRGCGQRRGGLQWRNGRRDGEPRDRKRGKCRGRNR